MEVPTTAAAPPRPLDAAAVLSLLEADQLVQAKRQPFGRRRLGPGLTILLWAMRVYVLGLLVVVAVAVVRAWGS